MEFFLASSDIVNIWESFLKKSTEKTPYDQILWKNTWIMAKIGIDNSEKISI